MLVTKHEFKHQPNTFTNRTEIIKNIEENKIRSITAEQDLVKNVATPLCSGANHIAISECFLAAEDTPPRSTSECGRARTRQTGNVCRVEWRAGVVRFVNARRRYMGC